MTRVALVLVLVACGSAPTAQVQSGTIAQRIVARAVVEPRGGVAHVSAPSMGRIDRVLVQEGDRVHAGDELATIGGDDRIEPERIESPIDGVVVSVATNAGDDVSGADGALFEIADVAAIRARFELEDADAARVHAGARVIVTEPGSAHALAHSTVARLAPGMTPRRLGADAMSSARLVRTGWADLEPSASFPIGRELEVRIELPAREVRALVPRDAVSIRDGRPVVLEPALIDREIEVRLGIADDENVAIEGVASGTVVRRAVR